MRTLPRLLLLVVAVTVIAAQRGPTPLQRELGDLEIAPHWIYDDLPRAMAEAKQTGKPVLLVLRCVPCPPGRTLDKALMQPGPELAELEKDFVCVRVVKTQGLDLNKFQYDLDQSWACFFLAPDGTIYGRYGSRNDHGPGSDQYLNVPAFRQAARRALALHEGYPGNRQLLAGHAGKAAEYATPEEIPGLQDRAGQPTTRKSCIHCHMVREYQLRARWDQGKLTRGDIFVYPMPDNIGLQMDPRDGLTVQRVAADSPAGKAGLRPGDEFVTLNGQALTSLADIQWVLHNAPAETKLKATVRRGGETLEQVIPLQGNWRESDIGWRASSWYGLRQGLKTDPLPAAKRRTLRIADDALALEVTNMFGKAAQVLPKAGLRKGDVIVAVDGDTEPLTESEFLVKLRLDHGPGDSVRFTILRGQEWRELTIPLW